MALVVWSSLFDAVRPVTPWVNIDSMVLPDRFIDQASPAEMYSDAGMSEGHVIDRCTKLLHKGLSIPENHTDTVNIQSS